VRREGRRRRERCRRCERRGDAGEPMPPPCGRKPASGVRGPGGMGGGSPPCWRTVPPDDAKPGKRTNGPRTGEVKCGGATAQPPQTGALRGEHFHSRTGGPRGRSAAAHRHHTRLRIPKQVGKLRTRRRVQRRLRTRPTSRRPGSPDGPKLGPWLSFPSPICSRSGMTTPPTGRSPTVEL
jgi:hypothetical protein